MRSVKESRVPPEALMPQTFLPATGLGESFDLGETFCYVLGSAKASAFGHGQIEQGGKRTRRDCSGVLTGDQDEFWTGRK